MVRDPFGEADQVLADAMSRFSAEHPPQTFAERLELRRDLTFYSFPQAWPSTALGFGGMGGQAITTAQTYVVLDNQSDDALVYFGARYAYTLHRRDAMDGVHQFRMKALKEVSDAES